MIIQPVILAGGGGTRLWPLSREYFPKQFLNINSEKSLLQATLARLDSREKMADGVNILAPLIICNEEHRFLVAEQARSAGITPGRIVLEPAGRNTAPALTCAALLVAETAPDTILFMMPADHVVRDTAMFTHTVTKAAGIADINNILTFGVVPQTPETGYGYIRKGEKLDSNQSGIDAFKLDRFVEKPDRQKAQEYLDSGEYLWNSGLFMMQATTWLEAMAVYQPDMLAACKQACAEGKQDDHFFRLGKTAFMDCPADSIDYAVMEKITGKGPARAVVVPLDAGWSDIGSWSTVYEQYAKTPDNNALIGDVIHKDTTGCLINSGHRLVATVGCKNMIIVETADAVLVADKDQAQDVKSVVETLKKKSREESLTHRKVYRPWGSYESLDNGYHYQVKRLTVNPGKKLSLQMHNRRAEHWVVVSGEATVTRGDETFVLTINQSTYIPLQTKHRLANMGTEILEVIEVQSGDYLGEDDIIRFDDDFGRETGSGNGNKQ